MSRIFNHYEKFLGLEIGLSHYVEARHYDKLSWCHYPLFYLKKYQKFRNRVEPDHVMRSLINNAWGSKIDFAVSLPNLNALYSDFSKWSNVEVPRDLCGDGHISTVVSFMQDIVSLAVPKVVTGPEYHEASRALDPDSSPGFPHNKKFKTRRDWIHGTDHESATLWWIQEGECIWNVSPKEEIRKLDKLESDQVRDFMAGLVEENLVAIICLGDLSELLCRNWRRIPFTVGMSTMHGGWNYRIKRWPSHCSIVRDLDGFKFEGSVESWFYDLLYSILSPFLDDTQQVYLSGLSVGTRRALFALLCSRWKESPCTFSDGVGCWKWGCNPSGAAWTIWVNTFCMAFHWFWCWLDNGLTVDDILANFAYDFHGDDSVVGSTPQYSAYTTPEFFNAWARSRGLKVFLKNEHTGLIHEVEYLSHITALREGMFLPVHKSPEKLLASACLKAKIELPKCSHQPLNGVPCPGWSVKSYHLARLAAICTSLWTDPKIFAIVSSVYEAYKSLYDDELQNDLHWNEAQKQFLGGEKLRRLWMDAEPRRESTSLSYLPVYRYERWF